MTGWNSTVKEVHQAARAAFKLWIHHERPCSDKVAIIMQNSRALFKYSLRACGKRESQKKADGMANNILKSDFCSYFWKNV